MIYIIGERICLLLISDRINVNKNIEIPFVVLLLDRDSLFSFVFLFVDQTIPNAVELMAILYSISCMD